jgi:hypothetical protein
MKVTSSIRRFATLIVLLLVAVPFGAEAQQFVCRPIVRGDTASGLALRMTGSAAAAYSNRFQIRDPARRMFVPKSRYQRLSRDWEACVIRDRLNTRAIATTPAVLPRQSAAPLYNSTVAWPAPSAPPLHDTALAWRVGLAVSLALFVCCVALTYVAPRPVPPDMRRTGDEFVNAFARPLIDPWCDVPPIKSRLRFVRHADQLEICLAPNGGRRYPNLSDHKSNVEYDVERVVRQMGTRVVVCDCLRAEGKWVVVPIRQVT